MTLREELERILHSFKRAEYKDNREAEKLCNKATDQIIALIKAKIPKERNNGIRVKGIPTGDNALWQTDGHNSCLSEIKSALGLDG